MSLFPIFVIIVAILISGIDNNTTTIVLVPSDFTQAARSFTELVNQKKLDA